MSTEDSGSGDIDTPFGKITMKKHKLFENSDGFDGYEGEEGFVRFATPADYYLNKGHNVNTMFSRAPTWCPHVTFIHAESIVGTIIFYPIFSNELMVQEKIQKDLERYLDSQDWDDEFIHL